MIVGISWHTEVQLPGRRLASAHQSTVLNMLLRKRWILCGKAVQHINHLGPGITKESTTGMRELENAFLEKQFNPKGRECHQ